MARKQNQKVVSAVLGAVAFIGCRGGPSSDVPSVAASDVSCLDGGQITGVRQDGSAFGWGAEQLAKGHHPTRYGGGYAVVKGQDVVVFSPGGEKVKSVRQDVRRIIPGGAAEGWPLLEMSDGIGYVNASGKYVYESFDYGWQVAEWSAHDSHRFAMLGRGVILECGAGGCATRTDLDVSTIYYSEDGVLQYGSHSELPAPIKEMHVVRVRTIGAAQYWAGVMMNQSVRIHQIVGEEVVASWMVEGDDYEECKGWFAEFSLECSPSPGPFVWDICASEKGGAVAVVRQMSSRPWAGIVAMGD